MGKKTEAGAAELMAALGATPDGTPLPDAVLGIKRDRTEPEDAFEPMASDSVFLPALFRPTSPTSPPLATRTACSTPSPLQKRPSGFVSAQARHLRTRAMATSPSPANAMRALCRTSNGVYQDRLPIDAEHKPALRRGWLGRGYAPKRGWLSGRQSRVDDRGRAFFRQIASAIFRPSGTTWEDPATRIQHRDVAIGGALTTRPFFKAPALRPAVCSEGSLRIDDSAARRQHGRTAIC